MVDMVLVFILIAAGLLLSMKFSSPFIFLSPLFFILFMCEFALCWDNLVAWRRTDELMRDLAGGKHGFTLCTTKHDSKLLSESSSETSKCTCSKSSWMSPSSQTKLAVSRVCSRFRHSAFQCPKAPHDLAMCPLNPCQQLILAASRTSLSEPFSLVFAALATPGGPEAS